MPVGLRGMLKLEQLEQLEIYYLKLETLARRMPGET